MKKPIIVALFAFLCFSVKAQIETIPNVNGNYEITDVVKLDTSYKKDNIYRAAKVYFVDNFKSANDVLQYQDQAEGKLIGKGYLEFNESKFLTNVKWDVYFTVSIECKEGKYRYRIYDINIKQDWYGTQNSVKKDLNIDAAIEETQKGQLKKQATNMFNSMAKSLKAIPDVIKAYVLKSAAVSKSDF